MRKILLFCMALWAYTLSYANKAQAESFQLNQVVMTQYTGDGDMAQYIMLLSTGDYTIDDDLGIYRTSDDGFMFTVTLFASSSSASIVQLPDGTYTMGAQATTGTWWNKEGLNVLTQYTKNGNVTDKMSPSDGTLTVSHEGGNTVINGTVTAGGKSYDFTFNGELAFQGEGASDRITTPVDATYKEGKAIYTGEEFGYGVVRLELYDQTPNEEGAFPDGTNLLKATIYVPQHNYNDGAFSSVQTGKYEISYAAGDFAALPGDDSGEGVPTGSYAVVVGDQWSLYGMIDAGSINIEEKNGSYTITADFTTAEGISIKGTYSGPLTFMDINEGGSSWSSTLKEDKVISYPSIRSVQFQDMGDVYQQGVRAVAINWRDTEQMCATTIEILLPIEDTFTGIPTGTFSVCDPGTYQPNSLLNGTVLGGYSIGTWGFQKLAYTESGQLAMDINDAGPAYGGSITITKEADIYTIQFDLTDDAEPTHSMTGSWSGKIENAATGIKRPTDDTAQWNILNGFVSLQGLRAPADLTVYDSTGRIVVRKSAWDGQAFDLNALTPGLYILKTGDSVFKWVK